MSKDMLIWGAGKIGRGFIADLANEGGYKITFVDSEKSLICKLKENKKYTVYKLQTEGQSESAEIKNFVALHVDETERIGDIFNDISIMALTVFPDAFNEVGRVLAGLISRRMKKNVEFPLDVLVCTNIVHPTVKLKESILNHLNEYEKAYFNEKIGLSACLVIRMAVRPSQELINEDELVVVTNGYSELIVDKTGIKGKLKDIPGIVFTENIDAEEQRKIFTYNMLHALYSYIGITKGYDYVYECTRDKEINQIAKYALDEIGHGLISEFGFSKKDMGQWNKRVLKNMANPVLKDKLIRVGGDPIRKLKRNDRLVGAALLCRNNGGMPYYLSMAIAYGYLFNYADDHASQIIDKYIKKHGMKCAVLEFSQIEQEPDLVQMIFEHYIRALENEQRIQNKAVKIIKYAYERGFYNEKRFKGCGQCTLLAMFEVLNIQENTLFQAASGFSGGMALCNDGVCGGYSGGIMLMSKLVGRKLDKMRIDGDKEDQYKSFTMAQKLHDRFVDTYGSVVCKDIHQCIFGEWFYLREKDIRDRFEEAGAHKDKCTSVVAVSCAWAAEILIEEGLIEIR